MKLFIFIILSVCNAFASHTEENLYSQKVQPIMEARCISCHSCFNAPCQLNLQTFEGLQRGAKQKNVYDGFRLKSVEPSRMFIDAQTTEAWRGKGFYPVQSFNKSESSIIENSVFLEHIRIRRHYPKHKMLRSIESAQICAQDVKETRILGIKNPDLGMPYGFPALNNEEFSILEDWIKNGAKGPTLVKPTNSKIKEQIVRWEEFLNEKSNKNKLVARYLYEHLFLAHLYFPEKQDEYYRLVRSSTVCNDKITEVATRRPNDDPKVAKVFYCFKDTHGPVVLKTHMPFAMSDARLEAWKKLFFGTEWEVKTLPSYSPEVAQNPFVAFAAIPAMARYQFLLDESRYHVMTFIKGPVCNGTTAVNSIQEQFYVFFLSPTSDPMKDPKFESTGMEMLMLPGAFGSDVEATSTPALMDIMTKHREKYRMLRANWLKQNKVNGLGLEDIWDGDQVNPNAILTIFRHDDNAVVIKGPVGNLPKTAFILDYSLFERLVYNLVVNFDVFGNVGHQLLTRVYMDYIRMEAEENFLMFLPPEKRQMYRNAWYQGAWTEAKMKYVFPPVTKGVPTAITYSHPEKTKTQFIEMLIGSFKPEVRGVGDTLNWRNLQPKNVEMATLSNIEKELQKITAIRSIGKLPFARYMPETSYIIIRESGKIKDVYSLIHNREFLNISWILNETTRRAPHEDTLSIKKGFWISYPNMIFDVEAAKVSEFVKKVRSVDSIFAYPNFIASYGVLADQDRFWKVWDELHVHMKEVDPIEFGHLDLTRYQR